MNRIDPEHTPITAAEVLMLAIVAAACVVSLIVLCAWLAQAPNP